MKKLKTSGMVSVEP